jgi:hypothetical protein
LMDLANRDSAYIDVILEKRCLWEKLTIGERASLITSSNVRTLKWMDLGNELTSLAIAPELLFSAISKIIKTTSIKIPARTHINYLTYLTTYLACKDRTTGALPEEEKLTVFGREEVAAYFLQTGIGVRALCGVVIGLLFRIYQAQGELEHASVQSSGIVLTDRLTTLLGIDTSRATIKFLLLQVDTATLMELAVKEIGMCRYVLENWWLCEKLDSAQKIKLLEIIFTLKGKSDLTASTLMDIDILSIPNTSLAKYFYLLIMHAEERDRVGIKELFERHEVRNKITSVEYIDLLKVMPALAAVASPDVAKEQLGDSFLQQARSLASMLAAKYEAHYSNRATSNTANALSERLRQATSIQDIMTILVEYQEFALRVHAGKTSRLFGSKDSPTAMDMQKNIDRLTELHRSQADYRSRLYDTLSASSSAGTAAAAAAAISSSLSSSSSSSLAASSSRGSRR